MPGFFPLGLDVICRFRPSNIKHKPQAAKILGVYGVYVIATIAVQHSADFNQAAEL